MPPSGLGGFGFGQCFEGGRPPSVPWEIVVVAVPEARRCLVYDPPHMPSGTAYVQFFGEELYSAMWNDGLTDQAWNSQYNVIDSVQIFQNRKHRGMVVVKTAWHEMISVLPGGVVFFWAVAGLNVPHTTCNDPYNLHWALVGLLNIEKEHFFPPKARAGHFRAFSASPPKNLNFEHSCNFA